MADQFLILHPKTQLYLSQGSTWASCQSEALVLSDNEIAYWLAQACEPEALEAVPLHLLRRHCCAA